MRYCLIRIAYDDSFHGFQVQPTVRTVQGEILRALAPLGIKKVYGSSRTDSHVRSSSSIVEVEYPDVNKVCKILDSIKGIAVTGFYQSEEFVKLRKVLEKEYVYLTLRSLESERVGKAIDEFLQGKMQSFSKDPSKRVAITRITFFSGKQHTILVFRGRSFSWNFVRISAQSIIERSDGTIGDEEWQGLLAGRIRARYKGRAENLILCQTVAPFGFNKYESRNLPLLKARMYQDFYWLSGIGDPVVDLNDSYRFIQSL